MKSPSHAALPKALRKKRPLLRLTFPLGWAVLALLALAPARATNFYVDTAAQFNAGIDKNGSNFSTLHAADRVYLKGGSWDGLNNTITGSMTDSQAQANPAIIYACDSSYNPTVGGVTVNGLCQIDLAGTGIVFDGVTFSPSSGMNKQGIYTDYSGNDSAAYLIQLDPLSRYMKISHVKFDYCGLNNTDVNNDHYGPWLYLNGYHHTIQNCEFQGRDFNPNDINQTDPTLRTSIRDATIVIYKGSADTTDYGYHTLSYNYFGQRKIPLGSDTRLYTAADGTTASTLDNGWETIRVGNSSFVTTDFNTTVEYNVFYHAIYVIDGGVSGSAGDPESISNKSRRNTYRYNTFLMNHGQLCLRQGDYCVVQGNYFLAGGAYDANGNIVFTEPLNALMGGIRAYGFGHTIANNYFYKLTGNDSRSALCMGSGSTDTGTLANLLNGSGAAGYETANYTQVIGNTFIDCVTLSLDYANGQTYPVYGTQFFNNLIYYSSNISADGIYENVPDALTNHGGQARGNYIYSTSTSQFGSAIAILGTGSNTITTSANPLMTGTYDVLAVPAANSPVINIAAVLPAINDTSTTGTSYDLAGSVSTYGGLDMRGLSRPATGRDIGDYEIETTGVGARPLRRSEVGTGASINQNSLGVIVNETFPANSRTTQNPPSSLEWFCSGSGTNVTVASGTMTLSTPRTARHMVAYFPPQTLNVGDSLTLSFNFSLTNPRNAANCLRAGLLYSGTSAQITIDGTNPSLSYTGYGSFINPVPSAANPAALLTRSGQYALMTSTSAWTTTVASGGPTQTLAAGTTYTGMLVIQRTGTNQVTLNTTYSGGSLSNYALSGTDTSALNTQFDTVALAVGSSGTTAADSIAYSNISIIKQALATVTLDNLAQTYDGTPKSATATTSPVISGTVNFSYNGSSIPPTNPGSYNVVGTINDLLYSGSATGTLVIADSIANWRQSCFGTTVSSGTAADTADPDGDGLTNLQEYVFGTNPKTPNKGNLLTIGTSGSNTVLSFTAIQVDPLEAGYGSILFRHYAVESTTDLTSGYWDVVPGYSDIGGAGQTVTITPLTNGTKAFYRLKAWLQ